MPLKEVEKVGKIYVIRHLVQRRVRGAVLEEEKIGRITEEVGMCASKV